MMKPSNGNQFQCPCCKKCQDCKDGFQMVVDLKNAGLVIHHHSDSADVNKEIGIIEFTSKTTEDVYILHDTKDVEIRPADYLPKIEPNTIDCLRCRKIIEHAQKLLQKVPTVNRYDMKGVCEHCRAKMIPCYECEDIVKKIIAKKTELAQNTKERVKQWLSKIKHLLKDAVCRKDYVTGQERDRSYSELHIDQLWLESPKAGCKPDVKQMSYPETHRSDFGKSFPSSIEKRIKMFARFPQLEHPTSFIDSTQEVGKLSISKHKKGSIATAYDSDMDLSAILYAPITKEIIQKKEKHVEIKDNIPLVPLQSEDDFIIGWDESTKNVDKIVRPKRRYHMSIKKAESGMDMKHIVKMVSESRKGELLREHKTFNEKHEVIPTDVKSVGGKHIIHEEIASMPRVFDKEIGEIPNFIRKYHSEKALLTTEDTEGFVKQSFSYVFPKIPDKKELKLQISSSELIKDTQDMLIAKAAEENKKLDKERMKRLEEEEKLNNAREDRIKQLNIKKTKDQERKNLIELEIKYEQNVVETKIELNKKETFNKEQVSLDDGILLENKKTIPVESKQYLANEQKELKKPKDESKKLKSSNLKDLIETKELRGSMILKENEVIKLKGPKELHEPKEEKTSSNKIKKLQKPKKQNEVIKPNLQKKLNEPNVRNELIVPKRPKAQESKEQNEPLELKEPKAPNKSKDSNILTNSLKSVKNSEKTKKEQENNEKEKLKIEKDIQHQQMDMLKQEKSKGIEQNVQNKEKPTPKQNNQSDKSKQKEKKYGDKKTLEKAKLLLKIDKNVDDAEADIKSEPEKQQVAKKEKKPSTKELNIKSIKVLKPAHDDLILKLVKLKQSTGGGGERKKPKNLQDLNLTKNKVKTHSLYHKANKIGACFMCMDSNIELDAESLIIINDKDEIKIKDIIIGTKIFKQKTPEIEKEGEQNVPIELVVPKEKTGALKPLLYSDSGSEEDKKEKEKQLRNEKELKRIEKELNKELKNSLKVEKREDNKQKDKDQGKPVTKQIDLEERPKRTEKNEAIKKAERAGDTKADGRTEPEKSQDAKQEQQLPKYIDVKSIKVRRPSPDDLILQLVKLKQSTAGSEQPKLKKNMDMNITKKTEKVVYHKANQTSACFMGADSGIELDAESLDSILDKVETTDIIIGQKIFKHKLPVIKKAVDHNVVKNPEEAKIDEDALRAVKDSRTAEKEQEKKDKEEKEYQRLEKDLQHFPENILKQEKIKDDNQKVKYKEIPVPKQINQEDKSKRAGKNTGDAGETDKSANEKAENKFKLNNAKEVEFDNQQPVPENQQVAKKEKISIVKDLDVKSIKVRKPSPDDLILRLVKLKQSTSGGIRKRLINVSDMNLTKKKVILHMLHHKENQTSVSFRPMESEAEFDADSPYLVKDKDVISDIIIGPEIFKYKPPQKERHDDGNVPLFFQSTFNVANAAEETTPHVVKSPVLSSEKLVQGRQVQDQEMAKGVIRYALSDRSFIDKGWTMLPTEKVVRKMNVYRMRPAHPEFDWFEHNKTKRLMEYDSGEKLAEFDDNGRGRWYYRNGRMALDYYDAEELNAQQRFVIYSSGEPDERGRARPYTLLATFDYLGNGIVFDHSGKIRLKYNQTEGVVLDRTIGPVSHWKWHTLNDPPVLQQVMIDTQMAHKYPDILKLGGPREEKTKPDNEDMLAIEFDNFIKEKSKKLSQSFKPFQIKMKALKINEHFSLKVLDQATVYLIFRDGTTNLKLNIGMVLDHKEIVDTDTAEVGEVSSSMEKLPARTDSLAGLQKSIAYAQRYDRTRTERELKLRPAIPSGSADKLVSATSKALRPPLRTGTSGSITTAADCYCKYSRKPSSSNVYYDNRLC